MKCVLVFANTVGYKKFHVIWFELNDCSKSIWLVVASLFICAKEIDAKEIEK